MKTAAAAHKTPDETITGQLDREKRAVSYDMYDMTVRQLVDMVEGGEIEIAPEYQRHFVWDDDRESELIESIYFRYSGAKSVHGRKPRRYVGGGRWCSKIEYSRSLLR